MMVYALWVVNRDFAAAQPDAVSRLAARVKDGFAFGLQQLPAAAASLNGKVEFTQAQLIEYIGLLNYQLSEAHQAALLTYYQMAKEMGLIETVPQIQFAQV